MMNSLRHLILGILAAWFAAGIVVGDSAKGPSSGTGFFISPEGFIATNSHVIRGASEVIVFHQRKSYLAKIISNFPDADIAILKIDLDTKPPFLSIASSDSCRLGDDVFTIGFPNPKIQGVSPKYSKGHISGLMGLHDDDFKFQISLPVQPGNSGGALANSKGQVVGIVTSKLDRMRMVELTGDFPENVNYAIKSNKLLAAAQLTRDLALPAPSQNPSDGVIESVRDATVLVRAKYPDPTTFRAKPVKDTKNPKPTKSTEQSLAELVRSYLAAGDSDSTDSQLNYYGGQVWYFDQGLLDRQHIDQDIREYERAWPTRSHRVLKGPDVTKSGEGYAATVTSEFVVADDENRHVIEGSTSFEFSVSPDGKWVISRVEVEVKK
ncbi:MAG: trypsin-like peptidase domain-containing protein [Verrucomicrobiota bacterium]